MRVELVERHDLSGDLIRRVEVLLEPEGRGTVHVLRVLEAARLAAWITQLIPAEVVSALSSLAWQADRECNRRLVTEHNILVAESNTIHKRLEESNDESENLRTEVSRLMLNNGRTTKQVWDRFAEMGVRHWRHGVYGVHSDPALPPEESET